jgi:hypothetical protein
MTGCGIGTRHTRKMSSVRIARVEGEAIKSRAMLGSKYVKQQLSCQVPAWKRRARSENEKRNVACETTASYMPPPNSPDGVDVGSEASGGHRQTNRAKNNGNKATADKGWLGVTSRLVICIQAVRGSNLHGAKVVTRDHQ